ncbi:unnamed protein product [Onchocerca flexuosa]|uniref:DUF294_C domain-containing protein n=1 Tax=Onchocerca flexuosa TaxID=387005 RepID=A0A183HVP6_9BILA|nr:unnamed protein product [Onchocerca flexuosa]
MIVDIHNEKDNLSLHEVISKLSLWQVAEWLIQKDEVLDRNIYGIVGKRLAKAAHEFSDLNDQEKKRILLKCIKHCFHGVFMQRSGVDLKILKTLMKLQRELCVTANQVGITCDVI